MHAVSVRINQSSVKSRFLHDIRFLVCLTSNICIKVSISCFFFKTRIIMKYVKFYRIVLFLTTSKCLVSSLISKPSISSIMIRDIFLKSFFLCVDALIKTIMLYSLLTDPFFLQAFSRSCSRSSVVFALSFSSKVSAFIPNKKALATKFKTCLQQRNRRSSISFLVAPENISRISCSR